MCPHEGDCGEPRRRRFHRHEPSAHRHFGVGDAGELLRERGGNREATDRRHRCDPPSRCERDSDQHAGGQAAMARNAADRPATRSRRPRARSGRSAATDGHGGSPEMTQQGRALATKNTAAFLSGETDEANRSRLSRRRLALDPRPAGPGRAARSPAAHRAASRQRAVVRQTRRLTAGQRQKSQAGSSRALAYHNPCVGRGALGADV